MSIDKYVRDKVLSEVKMIAIGNSDRSLKNLAIDLIHASGLDHKTIAAGCFLHHKTVTNLAFEKTVNPQMETIERVLRFFSASVKIDLVDIKQKYQNKPKEGGHKAQPSQRQSYVPGSNRLH